MATRSSTRKATAGAKRSPDADAESSAAKRRKDVEWEWLGDGKWTKYAPVHSKAITESFVKGEAENTLNVATGVNMKIRFNSMTQTNVATGWQRDIRCLPSGTTDYTHSVWEWEDGKEDTWKRYPEHISHQLEAGLLCGLESMEVTMDRTYRVNLEDNTMEDIEEDKEWTIRRVEDKGNDYIWQWQDENGVWKNYSTAHIRLFEKAYNAGTTKQKLNAGGRSYTVDFMGMKQTNDATGVSRKIRRALQGKESGVVKNPTSADKPADDVVKVSVKVDAAGGIKKTVKRPPKAEAPSVPTKSSARKKSGKSGKGGAGEDVEAENGSVKSQVFSGKAPVDSECTSKLGKAHVFTEGNEVWNCMLNQTNLNNNNNKFYIIQLLKDNNKPIYRVWFRWGRVGKAGQNDLKSFGSDLESAKQTFMKKFQDKTINSWDDRHSFVKVQGKYDLLEMDYEAKGEEEVDEPTDDDEVRSKVPPSQLPKTVQDLIEMICDVRAMEDMVKEMKYDTRKAPLGKLTVAQIKSGYTALKKIEQLLESNKARSDQLFKACDDFYTRIPHDFGMRRPPLIDTREAVKEKLALLEALGDIQIAMTVLQGNVKKEENPIDTHYSKLNCDLSPIDRESEIYSVIEKYVTQTHGPTHILYSLKVQDIFEVERKGETDSFQDHSNRQLLWHGSRLTNWVGILSQGLRIAPPEAPMTGYMFGKGIYFADVSSKSANYCYATPNNSEALVLLCEVSLGASNDLLAADYQAHKLPKGKHSVKGCGKIAPDPAHNHVMPNGCVVPFGSLKDTGVHNKSGYTLNYNEFIVYNTNQVKMRYLVKVKFNFK